jgi:hypothetical protein
MRETGSARASRAVSRAIAGNPLRNVFDEASNTTAEGGCAPHSVKIVFGTVDPG